MLLMRKNKKNTHISRLNFIAKKNACVKNRQRHSLPMQITCHMSTYHLSSFSAVQWSIGLGVQSLFLGDEVLGQHGMTYWFPM